MNRHQIRKSAFQTLFAQLANDDADVAELYTEVLAIDHENEVPEYLVTLVEGVNEHREELNEQIQGLLSSKWTVKRIAKSDLIILQIALFELQFVDDIPSAVVINEALELAESFSDDTSKKFINGVLGSFEKQVD
ncbi:transcription antitermination protein NusB [Paucilactobacillus oligofermentans DSM 15707 = LMG 22743]|uniref:Transcription antitermination protein NusB n=2 Tax=Paucilactobacillus oligofermentans TaxID=293371 RepID=A0A0R1RCY9_9LACO|nr:transcription antitermination protein NusB [Paucilactobacillus oligofermentans DSM 15707 = LMG 22743]CUS26157.1 Putative N utilization substance protein B [Paucilactobacillus oligofermentans DSM 15707 = LMG 22743]